MGGQSIRMGADVIASNYFNILHPYQIALLEWLVSIIYSVRSCILSFVYPELWPRHTSRSLIFAIQHSVSLDICLHYNICPPLPTIAYAQWPFSFRYEVDMANGTTKCFFLSLSFSFSSAEYKKYTLTGSVFSVYGHISNE